MERASAEKGAADNSDAQQDLTFIIEKWLMVKRKATPIPHWLNKKLKKHIHYTFYNIFFVQNSFSCKQNKFLPLFSAFKIKLIQT